MYVDTYDHTKTVLADPPPYLVNKRKSVGQDGVILGPCGQSRRNRMLGRGVGVTPMEAIITPYPKATFGKPQKPLRYWAKAYPHFPLVYN